jgi:hypothetical protein
MNEVDTRHLPNDLPVTTFAPAATILKFCGTGLTLASPDHLESPAYRYL